MYLSIGEILSSNQIVLANILSSVSNIFYSKKKFFMNDFLRIRDESVLFLQNKTFQVLALSDNLNLVIDTIKEKYEGNDITINIDTIYVIQLLILY